MKKRVEFALLSPLMSGGIRISDNFFESESMLRGSVLRAAFAREILMECPFADAVNPDGKRFFIERKDAYLDAAKGVCETCPQREICEKFSEMSFGFAFPENSIPAPMTAKTCKFGGTAHGIQDTIISRGKLACKMEGCEKRMESLKGLLVKDENGCYQKYKVPMVLSTHTAINHRTHTANDGTLYSVRAMREGVRLFADVDDCESGLLKVGTVIYAGKYASAGFGKMQIVAVSDCPAQTASDIAAARKHFHETTGADKQYAAVLLLSDALPDIRQQTEVLSNSAYLELWKNALFGESQSCLELSQIYTETQLYSGYNTAAEHWGDWKRKTASLMMMRGTSLLLKIKDGQEQAAYELLAKLTETGIGLETKNGFGKIAVCHEIHCLGVQNT